MAAANASAVIGPTPGTGIRRVQTFDLRVIALISLSTAATAVNIAPRCKQAAQRGVKTWNTIADFEGSVFKGGRQSARQSHTKHRDRPSDLIVDDHALPDQLFARGDQRADRMRRQGLNVGRLVEPRPHQMRQTTRVVSVRFVPGQGLQSLIGLPALDANNRDTKLRQAVEQQWATRPVSKTTLVHVGPAARNAAIAIGAQDVFPSQINRPSRSRIQICVSSIEISKPEKYFIRQPPFQRNAHPE